MIPQNALLSKQSKNSEKRVNEILKVFNSVEIFAVNMNLDNCIEKYSKFKTINEALRAKRVKLRELSRAYGENGIIAWIKTWLISIAMYMDFEITQEQAKGTALLILEEMYMLNMAEFTLLFKRMKKGKYGIFYGKFNGQTILRACKEFREERGGIISRMDEKEQKELFN